MDIEKKMEDLKVGFKKYCEDKLGKEIVLSQKILYHN